MFSDLNNWIIEHQVIVATVGIPLLTLLVTLMATRSSEKKSADDRRQERELQKALKIADFRRDWIETLREEFVEILAIGRANERISEGRVEEMSRKINRVTLLINSDDEDYVPLLNKLIEMLGSISEKEPVALHEVHKIMEKILRKEWSKLKSELASAEFR